MLEGMTKVLEILANKVSRKASIVTVGMLLLFLIATAETVNNLIFMSIMITGLVVFFTILQWILDIKDGRKEKEEVEKEEERK